MVNGKPMLPTPANVKYANRLIIEICERIRTGTFSFVEYFPASGGPTTLTVESWLASWLGTQRVEDSTRRGYKTAIRFWNEAVCDEAQNRIGPKALKNLRLTHILTAIANRPELSGKTINNYLAVLRQAMALAETEKLISANISMEVPRARHQKPPPDPFARDEVERIIGETARAHAGSVHNMVEFWFWTGLRTSEILGLDWKNVDLASSTVLIANVLVDGKEKDRTKTSVARTVMLNSRALDAIRRQREVSLVIGGRVFHDPRYNEPWKNEDIFLRAYWSGILKRLGIRYRRPYNMRHSYATAMLMAGMTPAFCARQLGHSVEMFLSTYAKWLDGSQNDMEMARLEASLSPNGPRKKNSTRK
jgi:integrase